MKETKVNPIIRLFPSLTDLAFALPILWFFGVLNGAKTLLADGDTGWHIRAGEWMLANGRVPTTDLFSYTKPDAPWFAWEWLWDVIMAWLHQRWGMAAVVFVSCIVLCFVSALVFRLILRRCPNRLVALVVTATAMVASSIHWLARPHLFTLLFTVIYLHILDRVRAGRPRLIWTVIPLMVLWTNLHGGFIVGLSILGCYLAGELVAALIAVESSARSASLRQARTYAVVLVACTAATFINPYTWQLHAHIIRYLSESYHFQNIGEFQSVNFHNPAMRLFEPLLVLALWGVIRLVRQRAYGEVLLSLGWLDLGLVMVRNVPIFLIIVAPVVADALGTMLQIVIAHLQSPRVQALIRSVRDAADEFLTIDSLPRIYAASLAVAIWLGAGLISAADARFVSEYDAKRYPAEALAWLDQNGGIGTLYTDDEWGDYVIYTLYPQVRVFVDGRSDFYGPEFGNAFLNTMRGRYDWEHPLTAHNVDTALLRADSALASTMKQSAKWQVIYDDGRAVVLRNRMLDLQTSSIAVNSGNADARIAGVHRNRLVAPNQP